MNPIVNTERDSTKSGVDGALSPTPHGTGSISFPCFLEQAEPRACGAHYIKRLSVANVRDGRFGWRIRGAGATAPIRSRLFEPALEGLTGSIPQSWVDFSKDRLSRERAFSESKEVREKSDRIGSYCKRCQSPEMQSTSRCPPMKQSALRSA